MGIFSSIFPKTALKRQLSKIQLEHAIRLYDAAKISNQRVKPTDTRNADGVMSIGGVSLRQWARHLDENHDLAIGILDDLVNNVIGSGLTITPMIKDNSGKLNKKVNSQIKKIFDKWAEKPEITGELPFYELQRQTARTWFRDGECIIRHLDGNSAPHLNSAKIPYSVQALEPDYLPFGDVTGKKAIQGVVKNEWGQPKSYFLHKKHPGSTSFQSYHDLNELLEESVKNIIHLKFTRRLGQTRGVSVFHGVITRLADIKDYEESERIAARIAADMTAFIKRGPDYTGTIDTSSGDRSIEMQAGMIIDNLLPGEDIGLIKSDRPNTNLGAFRGDQLRAAAAGTGTKFSTISKDYNGSYSAQRQEMVESTPGYSKLRNYYSEIALKPIYERFLKNAIASQVIKLAPSVDLTTIYDIDIRSNPLPWIDPLKEVKAEEIAVLNGFKSKAMVQREKYGDPDMINEQIAQEAVISEKAKAETESEGGSGTKQVEPGTGSKGGKVA